MFEITPLPEGKKPDWRATIDTGPNGLRHIEISHENFGVLKYGLRPEGYDGWAFFENEGGGSVKILYTYTPSRNLLIGLAEELRLNIAPAPVLCAIGGFVDKGRSHDETQLQETREESGLSSVPWRRLGGTLMCANRAFFAVDLANDKGIYSYASEIPYELLSRDKLGFVLDKKQLGQNVVPESTIRFLPWRDAIKQTPDALARAAIALLIAELPSVG